MQITRIKKTLPAETGQKGKQERGPKKLNQVGQPDGKGEALGQEHGSPLPRNHSPQ